MIVKGFAQGIDVLKDAPLPYDDEIPGETPLTDKEIYDLTKAHWEYEARMKELNGKN